MILAAYPQANDRGELHVWVGMLGTNAPAPLAFTINGAPANGAGAMHPMKSSAQDWSGRFVFQTAPAAEYVVEVEAAGQRVTFRTKLLPQDIPDTLDREFTILLCSCYSQPEDGVDLEDIVVRRLGLRPDLTIMAGDQVYLDLPVTPYPRTAERLTQDLRDKYFANWSSRQLGTRGIAEVLQLAPVVTLPDDHEFWNNYPYVQAHIPNTWAQSDRDQWTQVAKDFFEGFQRCEATKNGATRLDIGPLKILCVDMRSERDDKSADLMPPATTYREFDAWAQALENTPGSVGLLCSGQALITKKANPMTFNIGDAEMPNYSQFDAITQRLDELAQAGIPVVYLTGDVHWGRVAVARHHERQLLYEVICSPSTLIHTPGGDQWKDVEEGMKELFGRSPNPWPHHSKADPVPDRFGPDGRFSPRALKESVVGNQIAMVGLRRKGTGLEFTVTYHGISPDPALNSPVVCGPYPLNRY
jgi:hypothetical protein